MPQATGPAATAYVSAYAPGGTPPTPYSFCPLPAVQRGAGLNAVDSDGVSTRTVKAVPCGVGARETDGFTTCVGSRSKSWQALTLADIGAIVCATALMFPATSVVPSPPE